MYVHTAQDLIEMTIKKLDLDRDGKVSFSDFETTVKASLVVDLGNIPFLKVCLVCDLLFVAAVVYVRLCCGDFFATIAVSICGHYCLCFHWFCKWSML
jgi:hypothetical protein